MKKFQKLKENFICEHCGTQVTGTGYTNHCPQCLFSKHVDVHPGDRQAICGGMMEIMDMDYKGESYTFTHKCLKCGHIRKNKQSPQDSLDTILKLSNDLHKR